MDIILNKTRFPELQNIIHFRSYLSSNKLFIGNPSFRKFYEPCICLVYYWNCLMILPMVMYVMFMEKYLSQFHFIQPVSFILPLRQCHRWTKSWENTVLRQSVTLVWKRVKMLIYWQLFFTQVYNMQTSLYICTVWTRAFLFRWGKPWQTLPLPA